MIHKNHSLKRLDKYHNQKKIWQEFWNYQDQEFFLKL